MHRDPQFPVGPLQKNDLTGKTRDDIDAAVTIEIVGQDRIDRTPGLLGGQDDVLLPLPGGFAGTGGRCQEAENKDRQPGWYRDPARVECVGHQE